MGQNARFSSSSSAFLFQKRAKRKENYSKVCVSYRGLLLKEQKYFFIHILHNKNVLKFICVVFQVSQYARIQVNYK